MKSFKDQNFANPYIRHNYRPGPVRAEPAEDDQLEGSPGEQQVPSTMSHQTEDSILQ